MSNDSVTLYYRELGLISVSVKADMLQITNAVITVVITNLLIIPSLQPVAAGEVL